MTTTTATDRNGTPLRRDDFVIWHRSGAAGSTVVTGIAPDGRVWLWGLTEPVPGVDVERVR